MVLLCGKTLQATITLETAPIYDFLKRILEVVFHEGVSVLHAFLP
jgi:hypothetical protein